MRHSELRGVVVVLIETTRFDLHVLISVFSQCVDAPKCAKVRVVSRTQEAIIFFKNGRCIYLDDAGSVHLSWNYSNV